MLMSKETIIYMYKESLKNGDPIKQIKSLAKANNVKATYIKKILADAGLEVPEHIPTGPMKKEGNMETQTEAPKEQKTASQQIEEWTEEQIAKNSEGQQPKKSIINEDFEKEVQDMIARSEGENKAAEKERELPIPDAVRECLMEGLDRIDAEIQGHQKAITQLENKYRTIASYIGD